MRVWLVATTDLLRRLRNRSAVVMAVVAPLSLALVFGLLIGGTEEFDLRLGLVDLDRSELSRQVAAGLRDQSDESPLVVEMVGTTAEARDQVDDGDVDAAVVLPRGLSRATPERPVQIVVLGSADRAISAAVGRAVASSVAAGFDRAALAVATVTAVGGTDQAPADLAATAASAEPVLAVADLAPGGGDLDATAYFGGSMSILFLFFTVGLAARSVLAERRDGTLDRLLATPTSPGALVGGKVLSVSMLALGGFAVTWGVTSLVFGADWGPPATVAAIIIVTVLAIGGVALFVAGLARTPQQADAMTAAVAFAFALVGGNFLGPGAGPEALQTVQLATPNGWALLALTEAAADRAALIDVLPALAVLVAIGIGFGSVGLARIHRVVAR